MDLPNKRLKFENPIKLIDQGREALRMYYEAIGQEYNANDRHFKHSQPRMALGVALSRRIGDSLTGEVLSKDRTTIIHHKNTHDSNLSGWDGYATFFETAEHVVNTYFDESAKLNRIEYIDKMIRKFILEKHAIQSTLHV